MISCAAKAMILLRAFLMMQSIWYVANVLLHAPQLQLCWWCSQMIVACQTSCWYGVNMLILKDDFGYVVYWVGCCKVTRCCLCMMIAAFDIMPYPIRCMIRPIDCWLISEQAHSLIPTCVLDAVDEISTKFYTCSWYEANEWMCCHCDWIEC